VIRFVLGVIVGALIASLWRDGNPTEYTDTVSHN
jgi:hypothetical protein